MCVSLNVKCDVAGAKLELKYVVTETGDGTFTRRMTCRLTLLADNKYWDAVIGWVVPSAKTCLIVSFIASGPFCLDL